MNLNRRKFFQLLGISSLAIPLSCTKSLTDNQEKTKNLDTIILDFDGTLTRVEKEAEPFVAGYKKGLAKTISLKPSQLEKPWQKAEAKIKADPAKYGWTVGHQTVAGVYGDPYLMCKAIASEILDHFHLFPDKKKRDNLLNSFFWKNYPLTKTVFREGADEFLTSLKKNYQTSIVTNSGTEKVAKKLKTLPSNHDDIPLYGKAKKYIINNDWKQVPKAITIDNLERPILLRREKYFQALNQITTKNKTRPERTLVFGDNYELDLVLPQILGMYIGYIPKKQSLKHEIEVVKAYPKGFVANDLAEAEQKIMQVGSPLESQTGKGVR